MAMARAQASVEMVALLAGALLILLGAMMTLPEQYAGIGLQASAESAQRAADRIASAADEVYLSGDGAQKSVWIDFPEGFVRDSSFIGNRVAGGDIYQNRTVGIFVLGIGHSIAESNAPLCGVFPNESGRKLMTLYYNSSGHVMVNASC